MWTLLAILQQIAFRAKFRMIWKTQRIGVCQLLEYINEIKNGSYQKLLNISM